MKDDSFNTKYNFTNVRLWKSTHSVLKIIAALNNMQGVEIMDKLVMAEAERLGYHVAVTSRGAPVRLTPAPLPVAEPG